MLRFSNILSFKSNPVPDDLIWADFLFELGSNLAAEDTSTTCALLVLPILDLAAPLIMLGYLYARFHEASTRSLSIEKFKRLTKGASLIFESSGGPQSASFDGVTMIDGIEHVAVKIQNNRYSKSGGDRYLLNSSRFHKISIASEKPVDDEPKLGRKVKIASDFLKAVYGQESISDMSLILNSMALVGRFSDVENEINHIFLEKNNGEVSGNFNDLLRVDEFLASDQPAFSQFISSYRYSEESVATPQSTKTIIFRESPSYLKHGHHYSNCSSIILLDFADNNLDQVISIYNQGYYSRSSDLSFKINDFPKNIILAGYSK